MNTQQMMEEIDRIARLCEAKDAEIERLKTSLFEEKEKHGAARMRNHEANAVIAMQTEALKEAEAFAENYLCTGSRKQDVCIKNHLAIIRPAISASAEYVAAQEAENLLPLQRQVAVLLDAINSAEFISGRLKIRDAVVKTQATAEAYDREHATKVLVLDEADDSNWRSAAYSRIEELLSVPSKEGRRMKMRTANELLDEAHNKWNDALVSIKKLCAIVDDLKNKLSAMTQRAEAAEARIKASQEQEPDFVDFEEYGYASDCARTESWRKEENWSKSEFLSIIGEDWERNDTIRSVIFHHYAAPVIPPDVAELQRAHKEQNMKPAAPYTACANGCGIKAMWKVKRGGRTKNLCNACVTRSHDRSKIKQDTKTHIENKRKAEVLGRLGYSR